MNQKQVRVVASRRALTTALAVVIALAATCVEAGRATVAWRRSVPGYNLAGVSPLQGRNVYVADNNGVTAFDAVTGAPTWAHKAVNTYLSQPTFPGPRSPAPGTMLLANMSGLGLQLLNISTRTTVWAAGPEIQCVGTVFATPCFDEPSAHSRNQGKKQQVGEQAFSLRRCSFIGFCNPNVVSDEEILYSFDMRTGRPQWQRPLGNSVQSAFAPPIFTTRVPPPALQKAESNKQKASRRSDLAERTMAYVAYTGGSWPSVAAVDIVTGKQVWNFTGPQGVAAVDRPGLCGGVVVFTGGEFIFGLDAATGAKLWAVPKSKVLPRATLQSCPSVCIDGRFAVILNGARLLTGIDTANGKIAWALQLPGTYQLMGVAMEHDTAHDRLFIMNGVPHNGKFTSNLTVTAVDVAVSQPSVVMYDWVLVDSFDPGDRVALYDAGSVTRLFFVSEAELVAVEVVNPA